MLTPNYAKGAELAALIGDAYEEADPRAGWSERNLDVDNLQLRLMVHEDKRVAAVVPGTKDPSDWKFNLNFWPSKIDGVPGLWRKGFRDAGLQLWDQLEPFAREQQITVGGHSLGGAITCVMAATSKRDGCPIEAYTFGSPRACSGAGSRYIDDMGVRFLLGVDGIPGIVPGWWCHALMKCQLGNPSLWSALRRDGLQVLSDHRIEAYELALANRARTRQEMWSSLRRAVSDLSESYRAGSDSVDIVRQELAKIGNSR